MTQPEIRFNGFSDEWVEKKLGDVLKERKATQPQSNDAPLVSFTVENGVTPKTDRYDREGLVTGDKYAKRYKLTLLDDIVYNPANLKFGAISRNKFGKAVFSPIYVTYFQKDGDSDMRFVEMIVTSDSFIKHVRKYEQGTVYERQSVSSSDMLKAVIQLPTFPEQQKIGALFSKYDAIISLYEQKLAELNALKKGMLQQMFPKNGAKVPELRFAGFADDWEERKLGSELTLLKDGTHGSHQNVLEGPFLLSAKNIKNGKVIIDEITDRKISVEEYNSIHKKFSLEKGDVLLTIVGSIGETAIIENPTGITFQRSVAYLRPSHTILSQFLFTIINGQKFQMELKKRQVVSAQPGVYLGDLSIIPVLIPSLSEQQKIGQLFKHLDARISNEQSKIEQLKAQKQGLLQKML